MVRNLVRVGNSKALTISPEMRQHLGITDEVEVEYQADCIVLRKPSAPKPVSFEEAKTRSHQKYAEAYRELAK